VFPLSSFLNIILFGLFMSFLNLRYPEVVQISDKDGKFPLELAKSKRYSKAVVLAIKNEVLKRTGGRRHRRSSLRRNSSSFAIARDSIKEVLKEDEPAKK